MNAKLDFIKEITILVMRLSTEWNMISSWVYWKWRELWSI